MYKKRSPWFATLSLVTVCSTTTAVETMPVRSTAACDADFGDPATSEYGLPFPVGRTYRLIQGYCPSNPDWGHQGWFAYDFNLTTGDTILASRAGQIVFVRDDRPDIGGRCGVDGENLIVVRHADGTLMHYVHLTTDGALVERDDQVGRGQSIGLSGNSGCSSGPHLHVVLFEPGGYKREDSRPFNYRNAEGPLDTNHGLVQGASYTALEFPSGG